ncbi:hypothetical protein HNP37_001199 [Flavobacterium nitrogenifigens]|uniref:Uncharacterized protein n=2 Tax=Flavobacterium TaxID=237 RepID=A0A7W7IVG3_9FLAO|nr:MULTISPECIES: hypothetical protein [Flavobacterium]MBB4801160.1 hypothetical protein [Flavobacterium nitrogenifigens]MBB6385092.1 hypothetical protein [Flavobacterium notoginsengisoli]
MNTKQRCLIGLVFFLISYLFFSKLLPSLSESIDFAHWFNLIGACFLLSFNDAFPKTKINKVGSVLTTLGVIAHIGLCTIDFIMSSYGNNEIEKAELSQHISNSPLLFYPFVAVGPSLLFLGLAVHAFTFIKTETVKSLMVILGAVAVGISFFALKNGILMVLSCAVFVLGLGLLICKNDIKKVK